ncbi:hypothetical protein DVH24_042348 [Malus domestica]|uniref:Uncharacterized protein n=1 Tax=Malus domestica TaxID=3750 RepID=A0A498J150_MALDO|nr:hypothetical protein DVH24_042348 [Malus domestica]
MGDDSLGPGSLMLSKTTSSQVQRSKNPPSTLYSPRPSSENTSFASSSSIWSPPSSTSSLSSSRHHRPSSISTILQVPWSISDLEPHVIVDTIFDDRSRETETSSWDWER